jgi:hypothetical protein
MMFSTFIPIKKLLPSHKNGYNNGLMHNNAATSDDTDADTEGKATSAPAQELRKAAFTTRNGVVNRGHAGVQRSVREGKQNYSTEASLILATRNTGVKPRWLQVQTKKIKANRVVTTICDDLDDPDEGRNLQRCCNQLQHIYYTIKLLE